jgi:hypothetical protein
MIVFLLFRACSVLEVSKNFNLNLLLLEWYIILYNLNYFYSTTFYYIKLMEGLYDQKRAFKALDPRGIFLIQAENKFYLWQGK